MISARIRVVTGEIPDFIRKNAALLTKPYQGRRLTAWDIGFSQYGAPLVWTPCFEPLEKLGRAGDVYVLAYSSRTVKAQPCRQLVNVKGKQVRISPNTLRTLQLLFGFDAAP